MSEKEQLLKMIDETCEALKDARREAKATIRPANACPAHDAQFALGQSLCSGVSALLEIKRDEMREAIIHAAATPPPGAEPFGSGAKALIFLRALTPWRWPFAVAVFSPFAGDVVSRVIGVFR